MNMVVAAILMQLDVNNYKDSSKSFGKKNLDNLEENCFWIFIFIIFEKNWRDVYKKGMLKAI